MSQKQQTEWVGLSPGHFMLNIIPMIEYYTVSWRINNFTNKISFLSNYKQLHFNSKITKNVFINITQYIAKIKFCNEWF